MQLNEIFNWINSTSKAEDSDMIRRALLLVAIHHAAKLPNAIGQAEQIREKSKSQLPINKKLFGSFVNQVTNHELPKPLSGMLSQLFARLGNIATINKGLTPIQKAIPGEYPLVVTAKDRLSSSTYDFDIPGAIIPTVSSTGHGDASLKRIHYQEGKYAVGSILAVVQPKKPELVSARFIYEYLSVFKDELLVSRMVGTANVSLTINKIMEVPIPLVSGSIIDELPELMALCDQLEQQHSNAQEAHETLVSQLLATLTQSQYAAEFNANWQRINAHFDVLFTTEASIDALKQTLLQLAVMGKLVPQDPNDEPASELLKRIQAEKAKLIAEGKLKKEKPLAPIGEDEKPFVLPRGWLKVKLNAITLALNQGVNTAADKVVYSNDGYKILQSKHITSGVIKNDDARFVSKVDFDKYKDKFSPIRGDILFANIGTIGKSAVVIENEEFLVAWNIFIIRKNKLVLSNYLKIVLDSFDASGFFERFTSGSATKFVSKSVLSEIPIFIPPLAEQHRIVAKVDAMMALCDQLKTRIHQANQQQQAIADALVAQAVA